MNIALAAGSITLTKPDGTTETINTVNVVDVTAHVRKVYSATADLNFSQSVPQVWNPATATWSGQQVSSTNQWIVYIKLVDGDYQTLLMGRQTGDGAGWANTLVGANAAVTAIRTIL